MTGARVFLLRWFFQGFAQAGGRSFVRLIASMFDSYFQFEKARHSAVV
jgi:hypothetical protein